MELEGALKSGRELGHIHSDLEVVKSVEKETHQMNDRRRSTDFEQPN